MIKNSKYIIVTQTTRAKLGIKKDAITYHLSPTTTTLKMCRNKSENDGNKLNP